MAYRLLDIDNGIYNAIRKEIVLRGYLPDIKPMNGTAEQISDAYNQGKRDIVTSGKQIIEVFPPGLYKSSGEAQANNIVISRTLKNSQAGVGKAISFEPIANTDSYKRLLTPEVKYDISYKVTYITDSETYADIIESILRKVFSARKFIHAANDELDNIGNGFWVFRRNYFDTSGIDFIERGYIYEAIYIDLEGYTEDGTVSKLKEFKLQLADQNKVEPTDDNFMEIEIDVDDED